jgi:hypothetical protein
MGSFHSHNSGECCPLTRFPPCYIMQVASEVDDGCRIDIHNSSSDTFLMVSQVAGGLMYCSSLLRSASFFLEAKFSRLTLYFSWFIPVWTLTLWANYRIALGSRARNPDMPASLTVIPSGVPYARHNYYSYYIIKYRLYIIGNSKQYSKLSYVFGKSGDKR